MGTLMGHVVPGTFFSIFGLWWMYNIFYRYFYSRRFGTEYRSVSCFPCSSPCKHKWPVESLLKIIAVCLGMFGEWVTGYQDGHFVHLGNAQHITMFFFFGFNGLVDLCYHRKFGLPPNLDYVTAALGFGVEGFLFYNHLHGRQHMDIQLHMFLVYIILGCVVFTILEMLHPDSVLIALARVYCASFQGSWFYQIGFIIYPPIGPKWDLDDHDQMMLVTLIYSWHMAALLVLQSAVGFLTWCRVECLPSSGPSYQLVGTQVEDQGHETKTKTNGLLKSNGHTRINDKDTFLQYMDSESEEA